MYSQIEKFESKLAKLINKCLPDSGILDKHEMVFLLERYAETIEASISEDEDKKFGSKYNEEKNKRIKNSINRP